MSKFTQAAAASQALSIAAMEEASRSGQRTADLEHLLLALTLNESTAGQVLRSLSVTVAATRQAVDAQHTAQLAELGIGAGAPTSGPIVFHKTGGYEWSDQAQAVFRASNGADPQGYATAILRELVNEPSGLIESILTRVGTSGSAVSERLSEVSAATSGGHRTRINARMLSGTIEAFVPASTDIVWDLLVDPKRMPEWEPTIDRVSELPSVVHQGVRWNARTVSQHPDGRPLRVKPEFANVRIELAAHDPGHLLEWRFSYPDSPRANARQLRISCEPAAAGTQLHIDFAWLRNPHRPRNPLLGFVMIPLRRFALWMQLSTLSASISRALRSNSD